ncbi:MAG: PAS domain S-box protein [Nitrospiraceae bacterium]|nr:MAG: PAS domain S-box protein [Nitrospiraceae bacterium]
MSKSNKKRKADTVEISRAELESLQESEQRYRNILVNSSFGISAYDETGQCILANRALAEIIGAPDVNHILGQNMHTIRSWKPSGMLALAEDSLRHGSRERKTVHFTTTFGKDIWLDCTFVPYRERGKQYLLLIAENVTTSVLFEKSLMESEARYRALVESTSDWVWEVDENAIYTYASPKVEDILGYTPEEVLGKTPFDFMSPDEAKSIAAIFAPISTAQKPFHNLENTNLHKDGSHVVLETSGVPIFDGDGIFRGYRGIDRDITERYKIHGALQQSKDELGIRVKKRTKELQAMNEKLLIEIESRKLIEEQIRKSEEKFRSAALCTADLIWQGDVRENNLIWYGDIDGSLGYEYMEFPRTISGHMENIHPEDREDLIKDIEKAVAAGEDFYAEYRIRCKDGTYLTWNERGKPIGFENGKAVEWVGSVTDITQQKRDRDNLVTSAEEYKGVSLELLEKNTALKVLLEQRVKDQSVTEQNILQNIRTLVFPYLTKLKSSTLSVEERAKVDLIESNLEEIISPFARKLTSRQMNFSARELEIADLIRSGKQGKEIARILNLSPETINTHRKAIRRKLGLTGKGSNLRSALISISERQFPL